MPFSCFRVEVVDKIGDIMKLSLIIMSVKLILSIVFQHLLADSTLFIFYFLQFIVAAMISSPTNENYGFVHFKLFGFFN